MFEWLKDAFPQRDTGKHGEDVAARWLRRERGMAIVARNWRSPRDRRCEIDLVARDGKVLVFVEVKTRAATAMVSGYFAVDARKRAVLQRAIRSYVARLREKPLAVRFDIVEVALDMDGNSEVHHFENIRLFGRYWHP